ncbi:MAG: hypothetical protein BECKG1743D_GA0114223_100806 [Candidatus Kentron sp. G]|nr:MAG: hypothetical protein BECKG1743F_GA0114225_100338 [Candidatus Kentron sp. G]VFM98716.1 MAG: hypothetical protein BECKG1743D_GA0114223_100806 [Candidatus Kentron sp. G]VFM99642.1 MAG: hypothetical protein BECKG1743E_GA0114224_102711 [Candidatus Kentron sp. G]
MNIATQEATPESVWAFIQELARRQEKTDRQMQETDRQMQETDRKLQETLRGLKEARDLFTTQWGRLMESLVSGRLLELLNQRHMGVYEVSSRVKGSRNGHSYEFDLIAHNGEKIVIVEVKTTLRPDDIREFIDKLKDAKTFLPRYRDNTIHGAVAWLQANAGAENMAINQGLFSIRAVGDSASIINESGFEPKAF